MAPEASTVTVVELEATVSATFGRSWNGTKRTRFLGGIAGNPPMGLPLLVDIHFAEHC